MATHSGILAWRIPGTGAAWWAAVYGVAQSWTRWKRLSSSSSNKPLCNELTCTQHLEYTDHSMMLAAPFLTTSIEFIHTEH